MAETPESRYHLIGNEKDIVVAAQFSHAGEIAGRRHDDAAGGHDRFGNEGANVLGPMRLDRRAEFVDEGVAEGLDGQTCRAAERIGAGQFDYHVARAVHPVMVARTAVQRGGEVSGSMIAPLAGNDPLLGRAAKHIVSELHQAQRRLHCRGATGGVKDVVEITGRMGGKPP